MKSGLRLQMCKLARLLLTKFESFSSNMCLFSAHVGNRIDSLPDIIPAGSSCGLSGAVNLHQALGVGF